MATTIGGFKSRLIENRSKVEPVTTQYIGAQRQGLDTTPQILYYVVETVVTGSQCTDTEIFPDPAPSLARTGDIIRFTNITVGEDDEFLNQFFFVQDWNDSFFTLSQTLDHAPGAGNTYQVLRPVPVIGNSDGCFNFISFSANALVTSVNASLTSVTLVGALSTRKKVKFYNDSSATAYVKFGTSATTSSFSFQLAPRGFYEENLPSYIGEITAVWSSATGAMRVTQEY